MVDDARASGTVTFLFTDIEGSTTLWDRSPRAMSAALVEHDLVLRGAIERHGGRIFATGGDGFAAVFASAPEASRAAIDGQLAMAAISWPPDAEVRVRMGMHSGVAELRAGDYFGVSVNRAARVSATAHGGQIVLSAATAELLADECLTLFDLGRHRLKGLERPERLFRLIGDGMADNDEPLRRGDEVGNLRHQRARPIGRERELEQLSRMVVAGSMITITGVGGVGKTRLALATARALSERFVDGVWLIELADVSASSEVAAAAAAALELHVPAGDPIGGIVRALGGQHALLVLDNCEHVLAGAADLVDAIGVSCPEVAVLATSRQALGVDGEHLVVLTPLSLAGDSGLSHAAQLLWQRAAGVAGSFDPRPMEVPIIERICARLDGLPLAIELAATRLSAMTVEELDARLDDRFRLSKARAGSPGRHHSLRAMVAWSYEMLGPSEQMLFDRLSVFMGGFDLPAAESVVTLATGETVEDALVSLVDKSLVVADRGASGTRYRQLETLREFGIERLRQRQLLDDARLTHLRYFVSATADADVGVKGPDELRWHRFIVANWPNIRSAMQFACDHDHGDEACRLVCQLLFWAVNRRPMEMLDMSLMVLELPSASDHPLRPVVAASCSYFASEQGDIDTARALIRLARAEEARLGTVPSPYVPAIESFCSEAPSQPVELALEVQARAAGDPWANALGLLQEAMWHAAVISNVTLTDDERTAHLGRIHEAVAAAQALGNPCAIAYASMALGTHLLRTDPDASLVLLNRGLELAGPLDLSLPIGNARRDLIRLHTDGGRAAEAVAIGADEARGCVRQGAHASAWATVVACMPAMTELGLEDLAVICLAVAHADPEAVELARYFQFPMIERRLRERLGSTEVSAILRDRADTPRREAIEMFLSSARHLDGSP